MTKGMGGEKDIVLYNNNKTKGKRTKEPKP
jgi:hypothetical protein